MIMGEKLTADDFNRLFRYFKHTAFRMEVQPVYAVTEERESVEEFLAGEPRPVTEFPFYAAWLEQLAPFDASPARYAHNRTGEDNADAHMKRQIMGREVVVAITKGELDFGPWEQIFYGEFDGRRNKRVLIKIIGD